MKEKELLLVQTKDKVYGPMENSNCVEYLIHRGRKWLLLTTWKATKDNGLEGMEPETSIYEISKGDSEAWLEENGLE